jgi:quercetin dioxygenase-like cupin family protein
MSQQVARTPGAKRAGDGEYVFDLAAVNHILGGPDYSTANGACVEGDRMIVALMRMPAGTGAQPHSHPNEQWIYILQGTFRARIGEAEIEAKPGSVVYVPSNVRALGRGDARGRRRLFHMQGCVPQPARRQGSVTPSFVAAPLMVLRVR